MMKKKYVNKFHKLQFKTNAEKDMELNNPPISRNLDNFKIADDFSNNLEIKYKYSGEGEDIDIEH